MLTITTVLLVVALILCVIGLLGVPTKINLFGWSLLLTILTLLFTHFGLLH